MSLLLSEHCPNHGEQAVIYLGETITLYCGAVGSHGYVRHGRIREAAALPITGECADHGAQLVVGYGATVTDLDCGAVGNSVTGWRHAPSSVN